MIWKDVVPFTRRTKDADFDPTTMMKFVTWNVAGLRGMLKKDEHAIADFLKKESPDALCLQETKLNPTDAKQNAALGVVDGYVFFDHACSAKKGYSGVRTYLRQSTMMDELHATVTKGFDLSPVAGKASSAPAAMPAEEEGRVLTTFFGAHPGATQPTLALINTYIPNSGMTLDRLPYRTTVFDVQMRDYLRHVDAVCCEGGKKSKQQSPTTSGGGDATAGFIWTGDLNVAERDYDRYFSGTYRSMQECSGFTPEERASFRTTLKETQSVDSFRQLYANAGPVYTFWSARINGRAKGLGWRLDYFVVSERIASHVVDCFPMPSVTSSDHSPVQLWLKKA